MKVQEKYKGNNLESTSLFLLALFVLTSVFSIIYQSLHHFDIVTIKGSALIPAMIFSCIIFIITSQNKIYIVFPFLCLIASYLISSYLPDASWDSLAYHVKAIWFVKEHGDLIYDFSPAMDPWVAAYPKATWMFAGELAKLLGTARGSQCYQLILGFSLSLYVINFGIKIGSNKAASILVGILLLASPVLVQQSFSFYVDATIGFLGMICIFSSVMFARGRRIIDGCVLILASSAVINIKFSGFLYVAIAFFYIGVYSLSSIKKVTKTFVMFFCFLILGVGIIGNNPYIMNLKNNKNIFYPLFGPGAADIVTPQSPRNFPALNRFEKLFISTFSKSENITQSSLALPELKIPAVIYNNEINNLSSEDLRISGFGPLFSIALILSIILFIYKRGINREVIAALSLIALSTILNPEAWWARYAPQIYAIPVISILSIKRDESLFKSSTLVNLTMIYLIINSALVIYSRGLSSYSLDSSFKQLRGSCKDMLIAPNNGYFVDHLMDRYGFNYIVKKDIQNGEDFKGIFSYRCER